MRLYFLIVMLVSFLPVLSSQAAVDDWYEVELIVFSHLSVDADDDLMGRQPTLPDLNHTVSLLPETVPRVPFQILPLAQRQFSSIYRQLSRSSGYRPLLYTAWQQPALVGRQARKVLLFLPAVNPIDPTIADSNAAPILSGIVKIRSGYYLHATVDLAFFRQDLAVSKHDSRHHFVRLQETRQIKLEEKHYFDHPLFGVILEVRRAPTFSDE